MQGQPAEEQGVRQKGHQNIVNEKIDYIEGDKKNGHTLFHNISQ